jgi:MscS family membrane protein
MTLFGWCAKYLGFVLFIELVIASSTAASAAEVNPLRPIDTSNPRATLEGFSGTMAEIYRDMKGLLQEYNASQRLYLTPDQRRRQIEALSAAEKAIRVLDLTNIPPILRDTVAPERALQLKEVLDRIDLPSNDSIPDQAAMARVSTKRWRLPGTEIDIALVENGPRSGEYLVTADTVDRLPEFYDRVRKLPYKPGPALELNEVFRRISSGSASTIYEAYLSSPAGLERIIPIRWLLNLPAWAKARIGGLAPWQWLGLVSGLVVCASLIHGAYRLGRFLASRRPEESGRGWHGLLTPLAVLVVSAVPVPLVCTILRVGGTARIVITFVQTGALYLSAAWLSMIAANLFAEAIVASEHLRPRSLDSQLIRLGMRFAGIAIAVGFLIQGSWELGFPTYSVLAGLGVGGLAVALAARDSLANLLGSMLIMIEKPFRIGHYVRVSGGEGTVEDVGFRSTRIRTLDNSLISIPNNSVVSATVENLSLRVMRRERFFIQVTYDTSREKLEELAAEIKQLITDHPLTNKKNFHVRFNDFGESSLNILVYFYLEVADLAAELEAREEILFRIMDLAHKMGIEFAFPTRTLVIENPQERDADLSRAPVGAFLAGRSAE